MNPEPEKPATTPGRSQSKPGDVSPDANPADKIQPTESERAREWGPQPAGATPSEDEETSVNIDTGPMDQPDQEP